MSDMILHHYPTSPFSEKVRVAFGIKGLAWKSVTIPRILPKPDLMPLTGGYRKTAGPANRRRYLLRHAVDPS